MYNPLIVHMRFSARPLLISGKKGRRKGDIIKQAQKEMTMRTLELCLLT